MVGVSDMVNRMQGNFGADRDSYMTSLMRPELLILDDLGAERNTSFGKERVFDVINRRRLTGKPMIITTNIPIVTMQKAVSLDERRIYDRFGSLRSHPLRRGKFPQGQRQAQFRKSGAASAGLNNSGKGERHGR